MWEANRRDRDAMHARVAAAEQRADAAAADAAVAHAAMSPEGLQRALLDPDLRLPRGATAEEIEREREFDLDDNIIELLQEARKAATLNGVFGKSRFDVKTPLKRR